MNNQRRKELRLLVDEIDTLISKLEDLRDEEQEYLDNMPESFQMGEKGQAAEEAISNMEYALGNLEEAKENTDNASD